MKKVLFSVALLIVFVLIAGCTGKNAASGSEAIESSIPIKTESSSEESKNNTSDEEKFIIEEDKTLNINGKSITLSYSKTEKANNIQKHDRAVYVGEDATAEYDIVTGKVIVYGGTVLPEADDGVTITEQEAQSIAKNIISKSIDMNGYVLDMCTYNESLKVYYVSYSKEILGYKTVESSFVTISQHGNIINFYFNPYVFDDLNVVKPDEAALINKLDNDIKNRFKNSLGYEITEKRLTLNAEKKVALQFSVSVKYENHTSGTVLSYPIE